MRASARTRRVCYGRMSVPLVNSDQPDKLRFVAHQSFAFRPVLTAFFAFLSASFRGRAALQLEIPALRHQLGVLQRSVKRLKLSPADRFLWAWLSSVWNGWESRVSIIKAATVIGWQRKGFGLFWSWKIRHGKPGRPAVLSDATLFANRSELFANGRT